MKFLMSPSVLASIATLSNICPKDGKTPLLSKIKIDVDGDSIRAIGTDRYTLARLTNPITELDGGKLTFLAEIRDIVDLSKRAGKNETLEITVDLIQNTLRVMARDTLIGVIGIITGDGYDGVKQFPSVDKLCDDILSGPRADAAGIGLNPNYLLALSKVRTASNLTVKKVDPIFLEFNGPHKAVIMLDKSIQNRESVERIIMPVNR